jgi:hypothetical protein
VHEAGSFEFDKPGAGNEAAPVRQAAVATFVG